MKPRLETLDTLLRTALGILADLDVDPFFQRLVTVFSRMPEGDREPVLTALEREVELRVLAEATDGAITGCALTPNPNARLYFRVFEHDPESIPGITYDEFVQGAIVSTRVVHRLSPGDAVTWNEATREAMLAVSPEERASLARLHHHMLALIAEADAATSSSD